MRFRVSPELAITEGELVYVPEDYAFNFFSERPDICLSAITSVVIDTLQLPIDIQGQILYVWGYWPHTSWQHANISPPSFQECSLFAELETDDIVPGISKRISGTEKWETFFNPDTNWICIGSPEISINAVAIKFASGCLAVLVNNYLEAIWLHPKPIVARNG